MHFDMVIYALLLVSSPLFTTTILVNNDNYNYNNNRLAQELDRVETLLT